MNRKPITLALACLLSFLTLPGTGEAAPPEGKGKGGGDDGGIRLTGTFRDNLATDNLRSDGLPYVNGEKGVAVEITKDGDFRFVLGVVNTKKKGSVKRSIVLEFDEPLDDDDPCLVDPYLCPPDDSEPLNGVWFRTIGGGGGNPSLNFLLMEPGHVKLVKLFFPFSTTETNGFNLRFAPLLTDIDFESPDSHGGIVEVTACPAPLESEEEVVLACVGTDSDGPVDRWVMVPVPDTDFRASLVIHTDDRKTGHQILDYGYFRIPFLLTLDRLE